MPPSNTERIDENREHAPNVRISERPLTMVGCGILRKEPII
jgi:hypothetical protein